METVNFSMLSGFTDLAYDGTLTFAGALKRFFIETDKNGNNIGISKNCNETTRLSYLNKYANRILPVIEKRLGAQKPLHSYTGEDLEGILHQLDSGNHYRDSTMLHYRYLLWSVYRAGFRHGLYGDRIFWDDLTELDLTEEENLIKAKTRIRKSFTIEEEVKIAEWFQNLSPDAVSGEEIGLAIMFFLGVRDNEACGANFSCFHELEAHPGTYVFDMLQTTKIGSSAVKSGGKTGNAPRVLPVNPVLFDFIIKRKHWIADRIKDGEVSFPEGVTSVDGLHVVCHGSELMARSTTSHLCRAGKELFARIGIDRSEIILLQQILISHEFKDLKIDEDDPTPYLFRRNRATRLYHLGFLPAEIQYWMGHEIEDPNITRNSFSNHVVLFHLAKKAESDPINHVFAMLRNFADGGQQQSGSTNCAVSLIIDKGGTNGSEYVIHLHPDEPSQEVTVSIDCGGASFAIRVLEDILPHKYENVCDITGQQNGVFKKYLERKGTANR